MTTMTPMTRITKLQDEYFSMIKKIEEPVVRYAGDIAQRVARFVPERPTFMMSMPRMTEVVDNQLKFRRRMVDEQAMFVHQMIKAMKPVVVRLDAEHERKADHADKATATEARATRTAKKAAPRHTVHAA